jgi:anti-sigma B factor antagonist
MSLQITVDEKIPGIMVVAPVGSIDAQTNEIFKEEVDVVLQKEPKALIFDFAGVDFINSSGLGVIFQTKEVLKRAGAEFGLGKLQPQVKAVFDIIKALPSQSVFESVEEMDNYLARIQMQVKEKE